jgi:3-oxoacyl-[acyl-carrier-protein] synthase II
LTVDRKKVVITGIGIISPIGIGKEQYWEGLQEGRSGIKPITLFDASRFKVKVGGEITNFDPTAFLEKKGLRDLDRSTKLLSSVTKIALEDAHLGINEKNTCEIGMSVGTTFGSVSSISSFDKESLTQGPRLVNPSSFPNTVINSPASRAAIRFGIKGFNSTIATGMCSALDSIEYALNFINNNRAKAVIVGSVEEMCEQVFLALYKLDWLSGINGGVPISCPFDKRRNGIVFSEGATAIILEEAEYAKQRGANSYGEVLGVGTSFDPYRSVKYNPKGMGMKEAMKLALQEASLRPEDIDYICANSNSTKDADSIETMAIKEVFGKHAYKIPVTSIKSMIGETFSASGGMATIASIGAIEKEFIPPTMNYKEKDEKCDLDYVPNKSRKEKVKRAMINTFDFYGNCTVIIAGK